MAGPRYASLQRVRFIRVHPLDVTQATSAKFETIISLAI
jgi:hypothetical protein